MASQVSDDVVRIVLPPGSPRPLPWFGPLLDAIPDGVEVAVFQEVEEGADGVPSGEGGAEIAPAVGVIALAFGAAAGKEAGTRFGGWISDRAGDAWRNHQQGPHKAV